MRRPRREARPSDAQPLQDLGHDGIRCSLGRIVGPPDGGGGV